MSRSVLSLFLSLMLVATGHNMAQARGAEPAVGQMVICAGAGAVIVYVDVSGAPTHAPHMCPDCALHGFGVLAADISCYGRVPIFSHHAAGETALTVRLLNYGRAMARAPPISI